MASALQPTKLASVEERKHLIDGIGKITGRSFDTPALVGSQSMAQPIRRVLLAYDGTPGAYVALAWVKALGRAYHPEVRVVFVENSMSGMDLAAGGISILENTKRERRDRYQNMLAVAAEDLRSARLDVESDILEGSATTEICTAAASWDADLIVVGGFGNGPIVRALLGSVADGVRHRSSTSVLLAKDAPTDGPIVTPVDGSLASVRAALLGLDLARGLGRGLSILHAVVPPVFEPALAHERFDREAPALEPEWPKGVSHSLFFDHAVSAIDAEVWRNHAGLVVMGSRGLSSIRGQISGSVSYRAAHEIQASFLLVKDKMQEHRLDYPGGSPLV
ncbi:MAG: universal stress protein [Thermoplasmatota archaeon]